MNRLVEESTYHVGNVSGW